jgi:hypothetical protein
MKLNYIINIALALFAVIVLYRAECGKPVVPGETIKVDGKKYEVVKQIIDTEYIKVKETKYKKGEDIYHDTTIYVPIPVLDSVKLDSLVKLHYAKNVYSDTFKLNYGSIYVQDSVQFNKIFGRKWSADLLIPKETKTTIVKEPAKTQVYFGAGASYGASIIPSVGMMLKTKKDRIYGVSLGVSNGLPMYGGHIYIKLF